MSTSTMKNAKRKPGVMRCGTAAAVMLLASAHAAGATAAPAVAPHFVTIVRQIDVNSPASTVWAKVGNYCDLSKWLGKSCDIVSGQGNEVGTTRKVDHQIIEILVGKTATSYTYAQPETAGAQTHFYHGTLAVEPLTAQTSRIVYTLFYDNSGITDAAAKKQELDGRSALFEKAIETMKTLAESPSKAS